MGNTPSSHRDTVLTELIGEKKEGETQIIRGAGVTELIATPFPQEPDVNTAYAAFCRGLRFHGSSPCLGVRTVKEDGSRGPYAWETYAEVAEKVNRAASGLVALGLARQNPVGVFSINRPEWTTALLAIWRQAFKCVPLYDTLGASATEYIVNHSEMSVVFVSGDKLPVLIDVLDKVPQLSHIVCFDDVSAEQKSAVEVTGKSIRSFRELIDQGSFAMVDAEELTPDDLAYIMYTSGTTGDPKGVLLSQQNILASSSGIMRSGIELFASDAYLSYLPLAHSFETCMQVLCLLAGARIGFFQGDVRKLTDDILSLKPTVFAGVPRVYSRIYDRVMRTVESGSGVKRFLFHRALNAQLAHIRRGTRSSFWDNLVFSKTRERLGGRIRLMATGAAPMPAHIMEFLKIVFMCPVCQGYGMTENAAAAVVTPVEYTKAGTIGAPLPCTEVKLVDVPEMEYLSTDKPHPRGEVCLRGPNVFKGYFKLDKETRETLDSDGWLHTGDVGRLNDDGSLSIIDRKKNIFKLAQGEYVAAEECEMVFARSDYIGQIWVYGDSFHTALVAVVVPDPETTIPWGKGKGLGESLPSIAGSDEYKALVLGEIKAQGAAAKLSGFKVPKDVHIETDVNELGQGFSVANDCLTPTFKLRRPQLLKRYKKEVDAMYDQMK